MVQWLRVHLPMQGVKVPSLDTSRKATWRRWNLSQGLSKEVGGKQRSFMRGRGGVPQHR